MCSALTAVIHSDRLPATRKHTFLTRERCCEMKKIFFYIYFLNELIIMVGSRHIALKMCAQKIATRFIGSE